MRLDCLLPALPVRVAKDAVLATLQMLAMQRMRAAGVVVTNTESVLFEWLRDSRQEHFKAVSALIR